MSGGADPGSPRPRPLSGGFWTLLSWLRREERSSTESLSSVGSDKTAISFAFLTPALYPSAAAPAVRPPPGPPSDTYRRRVRDRNLRRQYDRDTTLHRKYGLTGYDALSLPPARRGAAGSGVRRAASECSPRRAAHVPGKRRAPPPPHQQQHQLPVSTASRRAKKRPAPPPPSKAVEKSNENVSSGPKNFAGNLMSRSLRPAPEVVERESAPDGECTPEKYTRRDPRADRVKPERSFLKQIFENRKRYSAVDVSAVRILPNISELDRQAAEIIEIKKLQNAKDMDASKSEKMICTKCFHAVCFCKNLKMSPTSGTDLPHRNASTMYTQTENGSPNVGLSNKDALEEKQKLKNMLKEMKDSLPKRPKQDNKIQKSGAEISLTDTPTLRIGSASCIEPPKCVPLSGLLSKEKEPQITSKKKASQSTSNNNHPNSKQVVTVPDKPQIIDDSLNKNKIVQSDKANHKPPDTIIIEKNKNLHTPLKISSLLNPIYVPKTAVLSQSVSPNPENPESLHDNKKVVGTNSPSEPIYIKTADTVRDIILNSAIAGNVAHSSSQLLKGQKSSEKPQQNSPGQPSTSREVIINRVNLQTISDLNNKKGNIERLSEHSRRRELVSQLEQSIARGDETAAAEAAAKLAQLRLSCSVLSFTSQILSEPSTSAVLLQDKTISTSESGNKTPLETNTEPNKSMASLVTVKQAEEKSKEINSKPISSKEAHNANDGKNYPQKPEKRKNHLNPDKASTSKAINQNEAGDDNNDIKSIQVWIEDKEKARGPIQLHVKCKSTVGDLRRQAEQSLGLPARLQRWIVGRALCSDDNTTLISLAGAKLNAPFYLCLVESDTTSKAGSGANSSQTPKEIKEDKKYESGKTPTSDVYSELVNLERQALVPNAETFECDICMELCKPGDGAVLRDCVHTFCRACLSDVVRHCEEPVVSCPATGCPGEIHEREIKALVSADDYQRWLARGLAAAESGTRNAFHCRTRDCTGWALCEIEVRRFPCPVCKHTNCVPCQAIHENETCEQYQAKLQAATSTSTVAKTDEGTEALIESLISRGEALKCPECSAIITKKWGCDWVKCSACKTEICWVTRGRRWGPAGRGDTSGGCRCGVDGKRCHPSCGYCH